jgi:ABC-type sulfate transport system permease component
MSVYAHEKRDALFSTIIISFTSTVADRRYKTPHPHSSKFPRSTTKVGKSLVRSTIDLPISFP